MIIFKGLYIIKIYLRLDFSHMYFCVAYIDLNKRKKNYRSAAFQSISCFSSLKVKGKLQTNKINTIIVYDTMFIIIVSKLNRDLFRIYS